MTRPTPRKSSLAGSSPIAPPADPAPAPATAAAAPVEQTPAQAPSAKPAPTSASTEAAGPKYRPKVSFYQAKEDTDRVRGAILHTMATEGYRGLSQFIHQAVMEKVEQLEQRYNGGRPFPPASARELPQGRPMGE